MKIVSKDSFMSIRGTDMHQGYTHASGVQTCIRGTDTCIRGTDMLQGYRHASEVQTHASQGKIAAAQGSLPLACSRLACLTVL